MYTMGQIDNASLTWTNTVHTYSQTGKRIFNVNIVKDEHALAQALLKQNFNQQLKLASDQSNSLTFQSSPRT